MQIDNGYDAWSIYNDTRTTYSNQPGVDRQYSTGLSARTTYTGLEPLTLITIATYADTTINYSYDGDWGNDAFWYPYTYDYFEIQVRHRSTRSLELRLADNPEHGFAWLFGVYALQLKEGLSDTNTGLYVDPFDATQNSATDSVVRSSYRATNSAVYGRLAGDLGARLRWSVGLRGERRTTHYDDSTTNSDEATTYNNYDPENNLWGGQASLDYNIAKGQQIYALVSRGYKAGGFNLSAGLPASQLVFGPEWDLNYELGHKAQLADNSGAHRHVDFLHGSGTPNSCSRVSRPILTIPIRSSSTPAMPGRATTTASRSTLRLARDPDAWSSAAHSACCRRFIADSFRTGSSSRIARCPMRPPGKRLSMPPGTIRAVRSRASM